MIIIIIIIGFIRKGSLASENNTRKLRYSGDAIIKICTVVHCNELNSYKKEKCNKCNNIRCFSGEKRKNKIHQEVLIA